MKPPREYTFATAFRVALESRLKKLANEEDLDLQRLRRQAAFDRLLYVPVFSAMYSKRVRGYEAVGYQIQNAIELSVRRLTRPAGLIGLQS